MKLTSKWVLAGQIQIESGQVLICDTGNIFHHLKEIKTEMDNPTYNAFLAKPIPDDLGVISSTGIGDGLYNVGVLIEEQGELGKRVVELRIRFLERFSAVDDFAEDFDEEDPGPVDPDALRTGYWGSAPEISFEEEK